MNGNGNGGNHFLISALLLMFVLTLWLAWATAVGMFWLLYCAVAAATRSPLPSWPAVARFPRL